MILNSFTSKPVVSVILACVLVLFLPAAYRVVTADGYPLGYSSFEAMNRMELVSQGFIAKDASVFHTQVTVMSASDYVMKGLSSIMGVKTAFLLVPPLLGVLSTIMIYLILRKIGIDTNHRLAITLLFATTPVFLSTFATGSLLAISFTMVIGAVYLFLKRRTVFFILSFFLYLLIPTLGVTCFIVSLFPLVYSIATTGSKKAMAMLAGTLISAGAYFGYLYWVFGMPPFPHLQFHGLLTYFASDLGGAPALGIFISVLFFVGLIYSWKTKARFLPFYILAALLFAVSLFDHEAILYLSIPVSAFAGIGVNDLFKKNWRLPFIRDLSFILVICGVLFSIISFADTMFLEGPSLEEIESLRWLGRNVDSGTILTLPEAAPLVYAITGHQVVGDSQQRLFSDNERGLKDMSDMFASRNLARTSELLTQYRVSAIWLPPWEEEDLRSMEGTGLFFLFRNNETFKKINPEATITIWAYLPYEEEEAGQ